MKKEYIIGIAVIVLILVTLIYSVQVNREGRNGLFNKFGNLIFINERNVYPDELNISSGSKVTWINNRSNGRAGLAIVRGAGGFELNSGEIMPGESFSYDFNDSGAYTWIEIIRSYPGKIVVD
ncbi:MAG TPA: hypothetical protein VI544_01425 [Candidatus Nanoarchaeia archaeon]|nr:hypothetical protein [Candidatus Nanoarchaeia archaeon]